MSCIIKEFKEKYNLTSLQGENISTHPDKKNIFSFAEKINERVADTGFPLNIISLDYQKEKLTVDEVNLDLYNNYINKILPSQLQEEQAETQLSETINNDYFEDLGDFHSIQYSPFSAFVPEDVSGEDNSVLLGTHRMDFATIREKQLKALKQERKRLYISSENTGKHLLSINNTISDLEKEIGILKSSEELDFPQIVTNEIERLEGIVETVLNGIDPLDATILFETNLVQDRVQVLYDIFNTLSDGETKNNVFVESFGDRANEIESKVSTLYHRFNFMMDKVVYNAVSNNNYIHQLVRLADTQEEKDNIIKYQRQLEELFKNPEFLDGDAVGRQVLGARAYDSILANIVVMARDRYFAREVGQTAIKEKRLQNADVKLRTLKDEHGNYLIDSLWKVDSFGVRTDRLISPYTGLFYGNLNTYKDAKKLFKRSERHTLDEQRNYERMMILVKDEFDLLQPQLLSQFRNNPKYYNDPRFRVFFDKYTDEQVQQYEEEMKEKLGETVFQLEVNKMEKSINNYMKNFYDSASQEYHENPFRFADHFYGKEPTKADNFTGDFVVPEFITFIPKVDNLDAFDHSFRATEDRINKYAGSNLFYEYYIPAKELADYSNDTLRTENISRFYGEVSNLEDRYNRAVMSELSFFGKVGANLQRIWSSIFSIYYRASFENPTGNTNYSIQKDRDFATHHASYGSGARKALYRYYWDKDSSFIIEEARKYGLTGLPESDTEYRRRKKDLINAIITSRINKHTSLDVTKRILHDVEIAKSINTRRSVQGLLRMFKDFAERHKISNTKKFLDSWEANNILQPGILWKSDGFSKFERVELKAKFLRKRLSEADKIIKEIYEKDLKERDYTKSFTFNSTLYRENKEGKYLKGFGEDETEISKEEIDTAYEAFIEQKIQSLYKHPRIGHILKGFMSQISNIYLSFNPSTGIKNYTEGQNQLKEKAASGLYWFNEDQRRAAARFLNGYTPLKMSENIFGSRILNKALSPVNAIGNSVGGYFNSNFNAKHKQQQFKILMHLGQKLNLLDNVADVLTGGDGSFDVLQGTSKIKELATDIPTGIPEFHNQLTVLLMLLQNPKFALTDKNGNKRLFFDPKTNSFPYDPETMQLLPEFREGEHAESNIAMWENFVSDSLGNSMQEVVATMYRQVKDSSQGNYSSTDKTAILSTATGSAGTMFIRWAFEQFNNEYGSKKLDPVFLRTDLKGKSMILTKHPTIFAAYTALSIMSSPFKLISEIGKSPVKGTFKVLLTSALFIPMSITYYNKARKAYRKSLSVADEAIQDLKAKNRGEANKIVLSMIRETLARTGNSLLSNITFDTLGFKANLIDKLSGVSKDQWKNNLLNYEDRRLLSEKIQTIANSITTATQYMTIATVAAYIGKALIGDDEDELEELEGRLRFAFNMNEQVQESIRAGWNPLTYLDTFTSLSFIQFFINTKKKIEKADKMYEKGYYDEIDVASKYGRHLIAPIFGMPETINKIIDPNDLVLHSERVYSGTNPIYENILNIVRDDEEVANKNTRTLRQQLINPYRERIKRDITRYSKNNGLGLDKKEVQNLANRIIDRAYSETGNKKKKGETEVQFNNRLNLPAVTKILEDYEVTGDTFNNKKEPTVKNKKSTSGTKKTEKDNKPKLSF